MSRTRLYWRFLVLALAITAGLGLLGYVPTVRLGGPPAVWAMLAGCSTSVVACVVGSIPLFRMGGDLVRGAMPAAFLAMGLRFLTTLVVGLAMALSGWFAPVPLLVWLALSYLALLGVETWYAVRRIQLSQRSE